MRMEWRWTADVAEFMADSWQRMWKKKSEDRVHQHDEGGSHEQASSPAATPPEPDVANVTVCDARALHCGVCFLALRPPIFQCKVGHVVCSACHDKLEAATGTGKCHVCGVATRGAGGYSRCHAMEHLVDSIRVPCPYSTHGCDATPPYHGRESHRQACPHAPCRCPGEACIFIGSTAELLDHFAVAHDWPCTTVVRAAEAEEFSVCLRLHDGFNFLLANHASDGAYQSAAVGGGSVPCRLFLLNVTQQQERLGRAISVLCIHPAVATSSVDRPVSTRCELVFKRYDDGSLRHSNYYQSSVFNVVCTDLSNKLPLVPNVVLGVGSGTTRIILFRIFQVPALESSIS